MLQWTLKFDKCSFVNFSQIILMLSLSWNINARFEINEKIFISVRNNSRNLPVYAVSKSSVVKETDNIKTFTYLGFWCVSQLIKRFPLYRLKTVYVDMFILTVSTYKSEAQLSHRNIYYNALEFCVESESLVKPSLRMKLSFFFHIIFLKT